MLEYKEETFRVVEYHELDRVAVEILGLPDDYSVVAEEEWRNDSSYSVETDEREWFDATYSDRAQFEAFLNGEGEKPWRIGASQVLSALAARGEIPWGNWLVTVCW